ncbi:MAG: class I SAM-dependent methyltransferase [bacterium]|nr:class I SAM-dependent methyltransferase [bacterium]
MKKIIDKFYNTGFFYRIFHTVVYCLKRELKDCKTVLDLGCGPSSPLQYSKNIDYSVGVEAFAPYLGESKKRKIHTEYIEKRIEEVDFPEKSFDAVIMIEVLEHLTEEKGYEILKKAEKWARKKVIVSTPNGFLPQRERDDNQFQKHLSGWNIKTLNKLGFKCRGLAGFRFLRQEAPEVIEEGDFMASIKKQPRFFWFIAATLSQLFTYSFPKSAFELFCVKKIYPIK